MQNIAKLKEKSLQYQSTITNIQRQLQLVNERLTYVDTYVQVKTNIKTRRRKNMLDNFIHKTNMQGLIE